MGDPNRVSISRSSRTPSLNDGTDVVLGPRSVRLGRRTLDWLPFADMTPVGDPVSPRECQGQTTIRPWQRKVWSGMMPGRRERVAVHRKRTWRERSSPHLMGLRPYGPTRRQPKPDGVPPNFRSTYLMASPPVNASMRPGQDPHRPNCIRCWLGQAKSRRFVGAEVR